eukprot:SAG31_NODE_28008_length_416_cov_2.640379_1_plen_40_part_01
MVGSLTISARGAVRLSIRVLRKISPRAGMHTKFSTSYMPG